MVTTSQELSLVTDYTALAVETYFGQSLADEHAPYVQRLDAVAKLEDSGRPFMFATFSLLEAGGNVLVLSVINPTADPEQQRFHVSEDRYPDGDEQGSEIIRRTIAIRTTGSHTIRLANSGINATNSTRLDSYRRFEHPICRATRNADGTWKTVLDTVRDRHTVWAVGSEAINRARKNIPQFNDAVKLLVPELGTENLGLLNQV